MTLEPSAICLKFVPLDALLVHEEVDPLRVKRLQEALVQDGRLRNPPIVAAHEDRYIVLDGVTRVTALRELGFVHILVQVVEYESDRVALHAWSHVIVGLDPDLLLERLKGVTGVTVQPLAYENACHDLAARRILACLLLNDGREFAIQAQAPSIASEARVLCRLVAVYRGQAQVHRISEVDVELARRLYPDFTALFVFPRFRPAEVVQIALQGACLPMGVTRHLISGRALGLSVSLEMLTPDRTLDDKNAWLEAHIRACLQANKVRLYQEPVFVFDD